MDKGKIVVCGVLCALALTGADSLAQSAAGAANARTAAERIGRALLAYRAARMDLVGDTTKLTMCSTVYRAPMPLGDKGPARVGEVVGSMQREMCGGPPAVSGQGARIVVIDSVDLSLTEAKVFARVRRGEFLHFETARLQVVPLSVPGRWAVKSIEMSDAVRVSGVPPN